MSFVMGFLAILLLCAVEVTMLSSREHFTTARLVKIIYSGILFGIAHFIVSTF